MATAVQAVNTFLRYVGVGEVPPRSDNTIFGERYGWNGVAWCDISYCEIIREATGSYDACGGKFASTVAHAKRFQAMGRWGTEPRVGAAVFFDWDGGGKIDHIGMVRGPRQADGRVPTVEGNISYKVCALLRTDAYIVGYGYPLYDEAPPGLIPHQAPPKQGDHGWVYMSDLQVGQKDSDSVRHYQQALRDYPDIHTIPLNPHGATGNYGPETVAMTRLVYQTFDRWQPGHGWGEGNLSVPGPALLDKLGLTIINR